MEPLGLELIEIRDGAGWTEEILLSFATFHDSASQVLAKLNHGY